jgi:glycosyltransferase involved in cell wall biosynthesis
MKVVIVHDWLVTYAGSERVLEQMLACFPRADIFSVVDFLPDYERGFLGGRNVTTTFIQQLPLARKIFRSYLPLMPLAVAQFDVSKYDLVISSSHAVAKGVLVGPDQLHICMCYSPIRYAWDLQHQYLREANIEVGLKSWLARISLHWLRIWDHRTAAGVDQFIAISKYIARRIEKTYRRTSEVIYPPVAVDDFQLVEAKDDYYLAASRMVPYKRMPLIVEAFGRMSGRRLIVIGDGPDLDRCRRNASKNVEFLGYQKTSELRQYMQGAKAFVFAAEEDFGITLVEAQASGTPVIAFGKGGALEIVRGLDSSSSTGLFFDEQSVESICEAIDKFEKLPVDRITSRACRENADRFSVQIFRHRFKNFVEQAWSDFSSTRSKP